MVKKCLAGILAAVLTMTSLTTYPQAAVRGLNDSVITEENVVIDDDAVETVIEDETATENEEAVIADAEVTEVVTVESAEEETETVSEEIADVSEDVISEEFAADAKKYHETEIRPSEKEITPATPLPTGNEAKATATGTITVNEAAGYAEGMYVEWAKVAGVDGYVGSYKKQGASEYTALDDELIRYYPEYVRADAVGLSAGTYEFKIDAMKNDAVVNTTTVTCEVTPDDRSGYCFTNGHNPGAYKADGTLKDGAVVVYVNDANFTTVKVTVGSQTYTGIQDLVDDGRWKTVTKPVDIRIIGTIDGSKFPTGYLSSAEEGLQAKSDAKGKSQPLTIEGIGEDAGIKNFGILFRGMNDVEVKNFAVMMCMDDSISINTSNTYFWVHNMDLFYGQPGGAADQKKGDGTLDLKDNSQYQTYAYNHFWDSGKCSLCGMKSESGPNYITYHHNWFDHSDSRHPRIRTMSVHVYNNYFDGNSKYGTGLAKDSNAFIESNFYRNCKYPILSAAQGNDIYAGTADGTHKTTFSGETGGIAKAYRNIIAGECTYAPYGEDTFVKKGTVTNKLFDQSVQFDAYEVSSRTETIPASVKSVAGGNSYNGFDTDKDLGVKESAIDSPADIPAIVTAKAGRLNGGDFAYNDEKAGLVKHIPPYSYVGKDSAGNPYTFNQDTDYAVIQALSDQLKAYKSSLVSIGGMANAPLVQQKTITLNPANGDAAAEVKYPVNSQMSEPEAPAKAPTGKSFAGWYIGEEKVTFPYTVTVDVTMTAKWLTQYTVTFDSNGGSAVDAQKVFEGGKAVRPEDPTKSGYSFKSWMNGTESYDFTKPVTGDLSLKASWINNADVLTVTFYNGSAVFATRNVEKGTKVENVSGERKGYDFVGWYSDSACTQAFDFTAAINAATSVYGKWNKKAGEKAIYTLYWGVEGGDSTTNISGIQSKPGYFSVATGFKSATFNVRYNDKVYTKALKFDSTGKIEFTTVNSNAKLIVVTDTASKRVNVDGTNVTGDTSGVVTSTLTSAGKHTVTKGDSLNVVYVEVQDGEISETGRKINFNFDYGTGTKSITTEDDTKTLAENIAAAKSAGKYEEPSLNGLKIAGWFTDAACTKKLSDTAIITDDIDLYTYFVGAHGERVYKVQLVLNGGQVEGDATIYAEKGQLIAEPEAFYDSDEADYIVDGWYKESAFTNKWDFTKDTVNGEMKLYCKWVEDAGVEKCTVTFDVNGHGTAISPVKVTKGNTVKKPANPSAEGYTFKGWTLNGTAYDFSTPVNSDITLKAVWDVETDDDYTVAPIFDGMEAETIYGNVNSIAFFSRLGFDTKNADETKGTPAGVQSHVVKDEAGTVVDDKEKDGLIVYANVDTLAKFELYATSTGTTNKKLYIVDLGESTLNNNSDVPARKTNPSGSNVTTVEFAPNAAFSHKVELKAGHKYFFTLGGGGNIMFSKFVYKLLGDVPGEPDPQPDKYTVTVTPATNGTVTASKTSVTAGETVTLTVTPAEGYVLDTLTVMNGTTPVTVAANNTFTMPAGNVTVTAIFKAKGTPGPGPGPEPGPTPDTGLVIEPSVDEIASADYFFTGLAIKPAFVCKYNGKVLAEGKDYTVAYKNNTKIYIPDEDKEGNLLFDAKKAPQIQITGKGNFAGKSEIIYFAIKPVELDEESADDYDRAGSLKKLGCKIDIPKGYTEKYTGDEIRPEEVKVVTKAGEDVTECCKILYVNNVNQGTATVVAIGNNKVYESELNSEKTLITGDSSVAADYIKATFKIAKVDFIKDADSVKFASEYEEGFGEVSYVTKNIAPEITEGALKLGDYELIEGKDFTVSYKDNKKVTDYAKIIFTGKGNFAGKLESTFEIKALDLAEESDVKIIVPNVSATAKLTAVKPLVFDRLGNLIAANQYKVNFYDGEEEIDPKGKSLSDVEDLSVSVSDNGKTGCIFVESESSKMSVGIGADGTFKAGLAKYKAPSYATAAQKKNNGKTFISLRGMDKYTGKAVYVDRFNDADCYYVDPEDEDAVEHAFIDVTFKNKAGTTVALDEEDGFQADDFEYVYSGNVNAGTATVYVIPKAVSDAEKAAVTPVGYKKFTFKISGKTLMFDEIN